MSDRFITLVFMLSASLVHPALVVGQDPAAFDLSPSAAPISLVDVVSAATNASPLLQSAQAAVDRERSMLYQVTRKPNPVLGYMGSEVGNDGRSGQQGMFMYQDFRTANKLGLNGAVQRQAIDVQRYKFEFTQLQVILRAHLIYLDVAYYEQRGELLQILQKTLNKAIETIDDLLDAGELGKAPLLQAKLEARRNEMLINENAVLLRAAQGRMASVLGWNEFSAPTDPQVLMHEPETLDEAEIWNWLFTNSPEVGALRAAYNQYTWQVQRERVTPIPDVQTQWSVQSDAASNYTIAGVQVGFELPIHNNNIGAVNAARAESRRMQNEIGALRRELNRRLSLTVGQYQSAAVQLHLMTGELRKLADENLSTTQEAFSAGEIAYLSLLNAQRSFINLRQETLSQRLELCKAKAKLDAMLVDLPAF